jgi:hypothetical protein
LASKTVPVDDIDLNISGESFGAETPRVSPKAYSRFKLALNKEIAGSEVDTSLSTPAIGVYDGGAKSFDFKARIGQENDNSHKFYMRNNLYSILYMMVQNDGENKELESMLYFMDKCKDSTVLNEICQLLLCFIIEMGDAAIQQILNACASPERFSSFVNLRLMSNPSEAVRSTAIRILTHFYQRLKDSTLNSPKNIMAMAQVFDSQRVALGINRFQESGGLKLLIFMLENKYCTDSSLLTYSALLEMLLTVYNSDKKLYRYADAEKNSDNAGKTSKNGALRVFALAPFSLGPGASSDEIEDCVNDRLLTSFFNIIPLMNASIEESLYVDLMTILKQNSENRDAFCANPHWNKFVYQLAKRYIVLDNEHSLVVRSEDMVSCLRNWSEESQFLKSVSPRIFERKKPSLRILTDESKELPINGTADLRFSMCMKLNSTLIVQATKYKNGWLCLFRSLTVMQDVPERWILAHSMLSHAINELTFGMHSRFRDLLAKVVSDVPAVKQDAYDQLENFLVLIIIVSVHAVNYPVSAVTEADSKPVSWRYLHINDIKPEVVDGKIANKDNIQHIEELMHPLERNHNADQGRLVLVLQCLRFFDILFSPMESGVLRNGQILKYSVRNLEKKSQHDQSRERLSLIGSAIRMCLFVEKQLCPLTELASVNVQRLSHLIKTIDKIPQQKTTPIESWILVVLQSALVSLKQIKMSLSPIFDEFGLTTANTNPVEIRKKDDGRYAAIIGDITALSRLEALFDSKLGNRLITIVRHLMSLIMDIFKRRGETLQPILGDSAYATFNSFMMYVAVDGPSINRKGSSPIRRRLSKSSNSSIDLSGLSRNASKSVSSASENSGISKNPSKTISSEAETHEEWGDVSDSASESQADSHQRETFLCDDIISTFKYLRDPFLMLDISRREAVMAAFDVTKAYEIKCLHDFNEDLTFLKTRIGNADQPLPNPGLTQPPTWSTTARAQNSVAIKLAKSVAVSWHQCLKNFEAEWSPWHSTEEEGLRSYELSRHSDKLGLRFILTRRNEPIDHSDAVYESNRKHGIPDEPKDNALTTPSSFLRDALKLTADSRKRIIVEDWGNESSFILEENASTVQEKRPQWAMSFEWANDEWVVYSSGVNETSIVQVECTVEGSVLLTNKNLYFHPRDETLRTTTRWVLECLTETYGRRHLLKNCGIELFFSSSPEVFIAFKSLKELQKFFFTLRRQNVPSLTSPSTLTPKLVCAQSNWTDLWRRRLISNFDYLIILNKIASRSFNDLTQYPVFPWILADYTSEKLDLTNPATFRDLSKPIGALNAHRLDSDFVSRYEELVTAKKDYEEGVASKRYATQYFVLCIAESTYYVLIT